MTDDLAPLLRQSIAIVKARKSLKRARLNLWLAKTQVLHAMREVEKALPSKSGTRQAG